MIPRRTGDLPLSRLLLDDLWVDDPPPPPWLINDVMVESQMLVLAGDAGVGKTLLMCVWAQSLASGLPILGQAQPPLNVLYINEENSWHDIREYLRWARYGLPDANEDLLKKHLRFEHFSLTYGQGRWFDSLRLIAQEHEAKLIIIDTATPACQIQDEDKNGEASIAIAHLRRAQQAGAPGCGMIILKHSLFRRKNKGEERTIRGAKAWKGGTDGMIFHTKTGGRPRADGLHCTYIWPDKARAFGLRDRLLVTPERTGTGTKKAGIRLSLIRRPEQDD